MIAGFLCWERSHVYKMYSICANIENGFFLLLRRKGFDFENLFSNDFLKSLNLPYLIISPHEIQELDGKLDILIFSDLFPNIERIKKTFTVIVQQSFIKDISKFDDWNYLFNLRLVYGNRSAQNISKYGSFIEVGNPRFDIAFKNLLDETNIKYIKERLDPKKKNLLYLPSLDNFSTFKIFLDKIFELSKEYNVFFKIQNYSIDNDFIEINRIYKKFKNKFHMGTDLDSLYDFADLVICDFGDAIFDAIYLKIPLILLQKNELNREEKYLYNEYFKKINFEPVVKDPNKLKEKIEILLKDPQKYMMSNIKLRKSLFKIEENTGYYAAKSIEATFEKNYLNKRNFYVKETLSNLIVKSNKNIISKNNFIFFSYLKKVKPFINKFKNFLKNRLKNLIDY